MAKETKDFVRSLIEKLFNEKRIGVIAEFYAPGCQGSSPDGPFRNREEFTSHVETYLVAFPDFRLAVNYIVAEEDYVVTGYTFTGTHTGPLAGYPPSGRRVRIPGVIVSRVARQKIVEQNFLWDNLGPRRQAWLASVVASAMEPSRMPL